MNVIELDCKEEAGRFLKGLLGDSSRRLAIMLHWHERCPLKGTTIVQIWTQFVRALLYEKLDFCIDTSGLYLFGTGLSVSKAFFIPYAWLTRSERNEVQYMVFHQDRFFKNREKIYHGHRKMLSGFIGNKHASRDCGAFSVSTRKTILRDFCTLVYQVAPHFRLPLALILQDIAIEKVDIFCMVLSKSLLGYTPDGPSLTPIE